MVEQVKYQVSLMGKSTPEGDKAITDAEKFAAEVRSPSSPGQTLGVLGAPVPISSTCSQDYEPLNVDGDRTAAVIAGAVKG